MRRLLAAIVLPLACAFPLGAQQQGFTRADTLRGSNGPARAWWDAAFYDLHVAISPSDSTISGWNGITYRVLEPATGMQIDLQEPLVMDSIVQGGRRLEFRRDGNAFFVSLAEAQRAGDVKTVTAYYHGRPVAAERPPWDGGFIWQKDSRGRHWVATANEGLGASIWWPNKDYGADEPDSQRVAITVPSRMTNVSNGRLRSVTPHADGTTTFEWFVANPINNYNISVNAGAYAHWTEAFEGEDGELTMDFWPLAENLDRARMQWKQAGTTIRCFEHWFGPYPWYEDGFKLIETPHLGMEHQSAVAYGNGYRNGYRGTDLSGTGIGLGWDFIIVHETAHEWWGNNISAQDHADLWVHESFANYAENIYTECLTGDPEKGAAYVIGSRARINNDRPIVGPYGVNGTGSGDMYYKGGSMLHTLRQLVDDDGRWREMLRGLNGTFRHQTVTGAQVEEYLARASGLDLDAFFDQYLRTTMVPALEYRREGSRLSYRWADIVPGFDMPVRVTLKNGEYTLIRPTTEWQTVQIDLPDGSAVALDPDFYATLRNADSASGR
jgi:aminopeptidase N